MKKLKKILGFPFAPALEIGYNRSLVQIMYKPLLLLVLGVLVVMCVLLVACLMLPGIFGPPAYTNGLVVIHASMLLVTVAAIFLAIVWRRRLYLQPTSYLWLCNSYGVLICLWSSILTSYAYFSGLVFTAFVYVSLLVALVAQFKPWQGILVFIGNFGVFTALYLYFTPPEFFLGLNLVNAGFAAALSIIIRTVLYQFQTRVWYNNQVITQQNEKISRINRTLAGLVHTDDLTGLYNRRYFDEKMPAELHKIRRGNRSACVMMLDIDHFKEYNDLYGHQQGDLCLQRVVEIAQRRLPETGALFARYGGEEFLLLTGVESEEQADVLAWNICQDIQAEEIRHQAVKPGVVTVSIGYVVCGPGCNTSLPDLARQADEALYCAKNEGRNRAAAYSGRPVFFVAESGKA